MACESSAYDPSFLVTAFHGIPHSDIDLSPVDSSFRNSLDYYEVSQQTNLLKSSRKPLLAVTKFIYQLLGGKIRVLSLIW